MERYQVQRPYCPCCCARSSSFNWAWWSCSSHKRCNEFSLLEFLYFNHLDLSLASIPYTCLPWFTEIPDCLNLSYQTVRGTLSLAYSWMAFSPILTENSSNGFHRGCEMAPAYTNVSFSNKLVFLLLILQHLPILTPQTLLKSFTSLTTPYVNNHFLGFVI